MTESPCIYRGRRNSLNIVCSHPKIGTKNASSYYICVVTHPSHPFPTFFPDELLCFSFWMTFFLETSNVLCVTEHFSIVFKITRRTNRQMSLWSSKVQTKEIEAVYKTKTIALVKDDIAHYHQYMHLYAYVVVSWQKVRL